MSDSLDSLDAMFLDNARKIVVCKREIELNKNNDNVVFVLFVEESTGSAGGRIGGAGVRRISKIIGIEIISGHVQKIFETENEVLISNFEIPLSAVAMDIKLSNGDSKVVQGIVDEEVVQSYLRLVH